MTIVSSLTTLKSIVVDGENGFGCVGTISMLSFELSDGRGVASLVTFPLTNCSAKGISITLDEVDSPDEHDNKTAEQMKDIAKVAANLSEDTLNAFFMMETTLIHC